MDQRLEEVNRRRDLLVDAVDTLREHVNACQRDLDECSAVQPATAREMFAQAFHVALATARLADAREWQRRGIGR